MILNFLRRWKGRYWLVAGLLFYLGTSLSSIIRSIDEQSFGSHLYMAADWFAACVVYFFLGAIIGYGIDRYLLRNEKKAAATPWWVWLTLLLWVLGVGSALWWGAGKLSAIEISLFPLAFGIFFTGVAFQLFFPALVQTMFYGKLALDILFLGVFGVWLYAECAQRWKILRRVLLLLVFLILITNMVRCAQSLGG